MSYFHIFALFRGIKLPAKTDIRENLEAFLRDRPELFTSYVPYGDKLTEDDIFDDWHDNGYLIDCEFLDGVFLGKTLWTNYSNDCDYHELNAGEYPNPEQDDFETLPKEVSEFILKYYDEFEKTYAIHYCI